MPPIVSIVGKSKSGKTTLIEKLIRELKLRGYRVATIKHVPRDITFDEPDKDSWRHIQAGSEATTISSPKKVVLIKPVTQEPTLGEVVRLFGEDYDIILTEGFKDSDAPKIETHRREAGPPLRAIKKVVAIVTDEPLETKARQFSFEDVKSLADLLEEGFIKPQRERVALYVNDVPISLTAFPEEIISNILVAMASSLRGVGEIKSLEIFLRKEPK
jgi:molybdopterin-guanine dinucleotide biosynthesis protein MobB